jgi:hypothetical protein
MSIMDDRCTSGASGIARHRSQLLGVLVALSTSVHAFDAPVVTVTPIFHQLVAFTLPAGFKTVSELAGPNFYTR